MIDRSRILDPNQSPQASSCGHRARIEITEQAAIHSLRLPEHLEIVVEAQAILHEELLSDFGDLFTGLGVTIAVAEVVGRPGG